METHVNVKVPGINIRLAQKNHSEVNNIVQLELEVWGNEGADAAKVHSRLNIFPEGSYVAEEINTKRIVGYVCFQQVDDLRDKDNLNWFKITDNGLITQSHKPEGEYLYGINLSVHYSMSKKNLAQAMITQAFLYMFTQKKKGFFVGSRIPMFKGYKKRYPLTTVEEYTRLLRRNGNIYDYELYLYNKIGLDPKIAKIIPGFFPDENSLNYGVLLFDENIFVDMDERDTSAAIRVMIDKIHSLSKKTK